MAVKQSMAWSCTLLSCMLDLSSLHGLKQHLVFNERSIPWVRAEIAPAQIRTIRQGCSTTNCSNRHTCSSSGHFAFAGGSAATRPDLRCTCLDANAERVNVGLPRALSTHRNKSKRVMLKFCITMRRTPPILPHSTLVLCEWVVLGVKTMPAWGASDSGFQVRLLCRMTRGRRPRSRSSQDTPPHALSSSFGLVPLSPAPPCG